MKVYVADTGVRVFSSAPQEAMEKAGYRLDADQTWPPAGVEPDYRAKRAGEYPSISDQLDEIWRLLATVAPKEVTATPMYQKIQAVKGKYKKSTSTT